MEKIAVIDLGSNAVRMTINQIYPSGSFSEIKRLKSDSRISEGMGKDRILQNDAMDRTIKALGSFKNTCQKYDLVEVVVVATAAVRVAVNQSEFLQRVKNELGIDIRVLSGDREAYYDYIGVLKSLKLNNCLILDAGGASFELINVSRGKAVNLTSIPLGAVNLSEKFNLQNVIKAEDLFAAESLVRYYLNRIFWLDNAKGKTVALLGGASRMLALINRYKQDKQDINFIHGYRLNDRNINDTFKMLISYDSKGREKIKGLDARRSDVIVGGMLPLVTLMSTIKSNKVIFSESGVREGIIYEYISKNLSKGAQNA